MLFSSMTFVFVFMPLVMSIYLLSKKEIRNYVLLAASIIFYAWGEPLRILLLLFSSFFNWFIGILIGKFRDTPRAKIAVGGGN